MTPIISAILSCRNEAISPPGLLPRLKQILSDAKILVVDDASTDDVAVVCADREGRCLRHAYQKGNGVTVKTGAWAAQGEILVFMDADGQHDPANIPRLLEPLGQGSDMVVGARSWSTCLGPGIVSALGLRCPGAIRPAVRVRSARLLVEYFGHSAAATNGRTRHSPPAGANPRPSPCGDGGESRIRSRSDRTWQNQDRTRPPPPFSSALWVPKFCGLPGPWWLAFLSFTQFANSAA